MLCSQRLFLQNVCFSDLQSEGRQFKDRLIQFRKHGGDLGGKGDLGGFVSIQGGNKVIWEPKFRPWQVTAKSSQVKPSILLIRVG